ncbi:MAG: hypothetical protein J2P35_01620 [Actinobacteria bacterium]|nr:hypothetical protein [Actinomycetota bacterium]MBO0784654.1 hypothetical protein [Actinomycetota bacterium]MBO0814347.1 hypothetical protein [Actinomycetota bacterium]
MKPLAWCACVLLLLLAGCTASPPAAPQPPTGTKPGRPPAARAPAPAARPFQRGIDINAYTYPGQDIKAAAVADAAFIKSLHANAVSISFPFFMASRNARGVYASRSVTLTPNQLALVIRVERQAGLHVSVRPMLDEKNLHRSRVGWTPADMPAWFASYRHLLLPYAAAAQRAGAQRFIVGTEFTAFDTFPQWRRLDRAVRKRFHGALACSNNWSEHTDIGNCGPGVQEAVDAYKPQTPPLRAGWEAYDAALPPGTVETEVGIAAVRRAYGKPWHVRWRTPAPDPRVQAKWFTAACHAAVTEHMGGIYFWPLPFSAQPAVGPKATNLGLWAGGPGARAIARCFGRLARNAN